MLQRGFLGPIGDDLPSLIPLSFALIMFFVSFTFALNQYTVKTAEFSDDLEAVKIASILRSNNYISTEKQWNQLCDSVTLASTHLHFQAGLVSLEKKVSSISLQGETVESLFLNGREFYCSNIKNEPAESIFFHPELFNQKTVLLKVYPVAWEDHSNGSVSPVQLMVAVWNP